MLAVGEHNYVSRLCDTCSAFIFFIVVLSFELKPRTRLFKSNINSFTRYLFPRGNMNNMFAHFGSADNTVS